MFQRKLPVRILAAIGVVAAALLVSSTRAQSTNVVLTLAVPDFMQQIFSDDLLDGFRADNPGVDVVIKPSQTDLPRAVSNLDDDLKSAQDYAEAGDVLFLNGGIAPEITRAGLLLDLAPLANGDAQLNAEDFYPALWQSYQWDNGIWGIPLSGDVIILSYDPAAFDRAGIAYPSDAWTMDDLASAARALTQRSADGAVTPGLGVFPGYLGILLRSLSGAPFYDDSSFPTQPRFDTPELQALLETWAQLVRDGDATQQPGENFAEIPLFVQPSFMVGIQGMTVNGKSVGEQKAVLLPGGHAGIDAQGFAVSAGTQYPEQAYALARYLSQNAGVAGNFFGATPARVSLAGSANTPASDGDNVAAFASPPRSPEIEALLPEALASGLSMADTRFWNYVEAAAANVVDDGVDAQTALQNAEASAVANLQAADAQRGAVTLIIPTVAPTPVLTSGQIALNFGLQSNMSPLPNRDVWEQLIAEFTATDPQVRQINFNVNEGNSAEQLAQTNDCFVLPYNAVSELDLTTVLNLDPFLDTDAGFDRNDVVGNTLAQLQRDNKIWALPLYVQPQMMRYDPQRFAQAGIPEPTGGWTVDQFVDALRALRQTGGDSAPFDPRDFAGTTLLMLIADYGGLPIDYRTDPPTINFTDPATVNAIRQVLDLAKDGTINYREMALTDSIVIAVGMSADDQPPITTEIFGGMRITRGGQAAAEPRSTLTLYPTGSQYIPLTYAIGAGYVSANAQNPDACYRWLSVIAAHPELFGGLPARRSQADSPAIRDALGPDVSALVQTLDAQMQSPNAVVFPTPFSGNQVDAFQLRWWLNRAFDRYVLHDADLETELSDAQAITLAYQQCVAQLPPQDVNTDTRQQYGQQFEDCAQRADPTAQ